MTMDKPHYCVAIIPARYASVRFPGKPLASILGKTLIQRTYENACRCTSLNRVIIATDDSRIFDHVRSFGAEAIMTGKDHATGTDRLAEAYQNIQSDRKIDILVNIQGDEPCIDPKAIEAIIKALMNDETAVMSTAATQILSEEEALNPAIVKCVISSTGNALYFSRSLIPGNKSGKYCNEATYYKHLGLYAYRPEFLIEYHKLKKTKLQIAEDLEQLKVLEHGYNIKTIIIDSDSVGVDNPEDIKKIENILCKQNTSL